jgi:tetratricopeptide (TPR) repeat protein
LRAAALGLAVVAAAGWCAAEPLDTAVLEKLRAEFQRGKAEFEAGRAAEALEIFDRILKIDPQARGSLLLSGLALLERNDFAAAAERLDRFLVLEPGHPTGLLNAVKAHQSAGQTAAAESARQLLMARVASGEASRLDGMVSYERERILSVDGRRVSVLETFPGRPSEVRWSYLVMGGDGKVQRRLEWRVAEGRKGEEVRKLMPGLPPGEVWVLGERIEEGGEIKDYKLRGVVAGPLAYADALARAAAQWKNAGN